MEALDTLGLFVESSAAYLDKSTGVSREIDIVAETFRYNKSRSKVCVKTVFVIEAVNNALPAVLLTPSRWTPNLVEDDYIPYCITPTEDTANHPFVNELSLPEEKAKSRQEVFSQFCGFTKKKGGGDLMASHPEDLYGSIRKAVEYALTLRAETSKWMETSSDDYHRIFQWRPVMVFGGGVYVLRGETLVPAKHAHLLFNFHFEQAPRSVLVDFVTESQLPIFVTQVDKEDDMLELRLHNLRKEAE